MNKKVQLLSVIFAFFLLASFNNLNLSRGIVVSNQLELLTGSYVEGRLLYSNSTVSDLHVSFPTIKIKDIFTTTDVSFEFVHIAYKQEMIPGINHPAIGDEMDFLEMNHLIFTHNRTTFLPAARLVMGNSTYYSEASILGYDSIADLTNLNNTKITINEDSYIWGDVSPVDPFYDDLVNIMFSFVMINSGWKEYYTWTLLGISPSANVSDQINYFDTYNYVPELGTVIDKPHIPTSSGPSFNTTHVHYEYNSVFGFWDAPEIEAYYEAKTGMLIRLIETDGIEKYEFLPDVVHIEIPKTNETDGENGDDTDNGNTFTIDFSIPGVTLGISALCTLIILRRRKG